MSTGLFGAKTADEALELLQEGNRRFVEDRREPQTDIAAVRTELAKGQKPYAVIIGCSDSRVSPEIIFDEGIGRLFVIRTAGNVESPVEIGSAEYAAEHLGTRLIVVLGHEKCGAVKAAVDGGGDVGPNLGAIVSEIKPSLDIVKSRFDGDIASHCEDENIAHSIEKLKTSGILMRLVKKEGLKIVGAKYHIDTGEVVFFKNRP